MSEVYYSHPREGRRAIRKAAKSIQKLNGEPTAADRIILVHRVAYLTNRCERYRHVSPKVIFVELRPMPAV